jgi:hypothetical protein
MMNEYVWYASYGSNINRDRFLCYIKGGAPAGSTRIENGCRDSSLPVEESSFIIKYPLYFAKEATGWQSQGVAFLGLSPDKECVTYSKKYLITTEQFLDVVQQENDGLECDIDLAKVKEKGSIVFRPNAWYGNILYLGEEDGYPIFTFTAPWDIADVVMKKPSHVYLKTIINGLKTDYSNEEILNYFKNTPGIKGKYTDDELAGIIF